MGDRLMLDPAWYNKDVADIQMDYLITEVHLQGTRHNPKQLIFMFMKMPIKLTQQFGHFHLLAIQFCNNLGGPVLVHHGQFLRGIDDLYAHSTEAPGKVPVNKEGNPAIRWRNYSMPIKIP